MIELGIDEITLVIRPSPLYKDNNESLGWQSQAEDLISIFSSQSQFAEVFGERILEKKVPQGYTLAYTYGLHNFYFAVAYHPEYSKVGIVVKFSAQAFHYYLNKTQLRPYDYLKNVQNENYSTRLSRIDLTADYINEDIELTNIYDLWNQEKIITVREYDNKKIGSTYFRKCKMQVTGYFSDNNISTMYIGSNKSKSKLRIYDKKSEQIQQHGIDLKKALEVKSWIRFEAMFRDEYAHQITEILLKINNDNEYAEMIAAIIYQKYRFMYAKDGVLLKDTEFSRSLHECISKDNFSLKSAAYKNYDLANSVVYLIQGSGLFATIYKVKTLWGEESVEELIHYFKKIFNDYEPNHDVISWISKYGKDYLEQYQNFDSFISQNLIVLLKSKNYIDEFVHI